MTALALAPPADVPTFNISCKAFSSPFKRFVLKSDLPDKILLASSINCHNSIFPELSLSFGIGGSNSKAPIPLFPI